MNLPAVILAVATLGLGSASIYLYTELDAARGRADAETALRQDQEARVKALEEMRMRLERQLRGSGSTRGRNVPSTSDAGTLSPRNPAGAAPGNAQERRPEGDFGRGFRNRMNTPEGRKALLAAQKMGLRATYKDLAKELNLSTDQANQLIDVLAKHQAAQFDGMRELRGDPAAMRAAVAERERLNEIELMGVLGSKYQQYQSYQDTLGERAEVDRLGVQFAASNLPLADSQKKQLMTAMVEERKASAQPQWSQDATPQENMEQMRRWQENYNKRLVERAGAVLNADQLAQYKEMQSAQSTPAGGALAMGVNGRGMRLGGRPAPGR